MSMSLKAIKNLRQSISDDIPIIGIGDHPHPQHKRAGVEKRIIRVEPVQLRRIKEGDAMGKQSE